MLLISLLFVCNSAWTDANTPAAWSDDDDADRAVDISSVPRLRKLRDRHDELSVSQNEYAKRLRTQ